MLWARTAAIALSCALALGACGRGNASERPRVDRLVACDLVTADEVATALGGAVDAPDATDDGGADALAGRSGCAWATNDGRGAALFELVRNNDMASSVRRTGFSAAARYNSARSRHGGEVVEHVGNRAFWVEETATLYVLAGSSYLVIEVATRDVDRSRAAAISLATPAVTRLSDGGRQTEPEND